MKIPAAKIYFQEEDRKELLKQIDGILESGQLTLGKYTKEFEERFAAYVGTKYAIAVNSGTCALEITFKSVGHERVFSDCANEHVFRNACIGDTRQGKVIFADVTGNLCIEPESINENLRDNTKGLLLRILEHHSAKEIREICEDHNLFLIEDAAHARGSTLDGKMAGGFVKVGKGIYMKKEEVLSWKS